VRSFTESDCMLRGPTATPTIPLTQGRPWAPAARKRLSFLDRFLTLWIASHI